ncbi:universal stress protein [Thalassococcus lentus]|uniref:Universal stress protein n=1 Tax=Thalassococcus lentus TaxID=1210524 RepID=A0ABT4XVX1_9RHOB|nr:universal stress protein [Thalassococcus lentus]MDA7426107.1 universal stress protein [Thalassococcus lentus]
MSYKTVLSVVTDQALAESAVQQAADLARGYDAHLDVMCLGVDRTQTGYYYAGANAMVLQETLNRAQAEGQALEAQVRALLGKSECRWSAESGVAQLADIGRHVALHARFSDLVVLPKPYGAERGLELEPIVEGALFEGRAPVMILADNRPATAKPKRIVIGWNESAEALSAVRAAMPLLVEAEMVHLAVIDPPTHGPNRSDPGGLLAQYLARHGVRAEIDVLSKTLPRVSDVLMRHAGDVNADLVVMGAYGHSRFREAILGGATRNMLERAEIPVLMSH